MQVGAIIPTMLPSMCMKMIGDGATIGDGIIIGVIDLGEATGDGDGTPTGAARIGADMLTTDLPTGEAGIALITMVDTMAMDIMAETTLTTEEEEM